jgi:hypothetical protein
MAFSDGVIPEEFNAILRERDRKLNTALATNGFEVYSAGTIYKIPNPEGLESIDIIDALVDKFPSLGEDISLRGDTILCPEDNFERFKTARDAYRRVFREDVEAGKWPEEVFLGLESKFGSKSWVDELRVAAGKPVEKTHRYYGNKKCPGSKDSVCGGTGGQCSYATCPLY